MKPWHNTLKFSQPLRSVRAAGNTTVISITSCPAPQETEAQALYEKGRVDGEKALSEMLMRQRAEVHSLMEGALKAMRLAVPQVVRDTENTLVALALSVAQKLVSGIPITVPMVEGAVRDALAQVEGTAHFTVRLHPADLELLQKSSSPVLAPEEDGREFRFLSSPEVTRGGCLVQTQFGTVDARRETKFDLLKTALVA